MTRSFVFLFAVPWVLGACAGDAPRAAYWEHAGGGDAARFALDNEHCGAAATRVSPTPRADQLPGGAVAPANRIDRPPRPWADGVAERAYLDCMAREGWRVAGR
ncbi:MAG TPA: hypothetical protein VHQ02_01350 [Usitatibacter sp.]|jgi:hypothetical protein|nr:hypothetical protein [Usitatibacter sp.]